MSNHEEADTRFILHAINAVQVGYGRLMIVSPNTDVLVLLCHFTSNLCSEVWMQMKTVNQHIFIPFHILDMNIRKNFWHFIQ